MRLFVFSVGAQVWQPRGAHAAELRPHPHHALRASAQGRHVPRVDGRRHAGDAEATLQSPVVIHRTRYAFRLSFRVPVCTAMESNAECVWVHLLFRF